MKQEMLINVAQAEECRIAIVEDGVLEELYLERLSQQNFVGNIYKGRIVNLEPSIQAAFVDFGVGRNGFLHISDVEPQYFRQGGYDPRQADMPNGGGQSRGRDFEQHEGDDRDDLDDDSDGPPAATATATATATAAAARPPAKSHRDSAPAFAPASSRRFRKSFSAATKFSSKSSRKASARKVRRSPRTSASRAVTSC